MHIVHQLAEDRWRACLDGHPHAGIFHTPEMYQVFARAEGHTPVLWAATDDAGHVLALLPLVLVRSPRGLPRLISTRAVAYGGVLHALTEQGREAAARLLEAYAGAKPAALFTELRHLHDPADLRPALNGAGFLHSDHLNYLIDLDQPESALWANIGARTRKHLRRALRRDDMAISAASRDQLPAVYDLLRRTYDRARVPLSEPSLFEAAFDVLQPLGMAHCFVACHEGKPIAATVELGYRETLYGWYAGMDRDSAAYVPNERLMWHVLRWARQQGYRRYDFGGAGAPGEDYGVRRFKAKFGGRLVNYGRSTVAHRPRLLALSKIGYAAYRRVRALVRG